MVQCRGKFYAAARNPGMLAPVLNLCVVMQKLRRAIDGAAVGLNQTCANCGLRFGTAARKTMGDEEYVGAGALGRRDQAVSAAASVARPSAERPAATMLFASSPADSYICSGLA